MMEIEFGGMAFKAVSKIIEAGVLFSFMILVDVVLVWFVMYLMKELKAARQESTAALMDNTKILIELKEVVKNALHKEG